jgi:hypothetical protein
MHHPDELKMREPVSGMVKDFFRGLNSQNFRCGWRVPVITIYLKLREAAMDSF